MTVAKCDEYGVAPCLDYDKEPISYEVYVTAIDSYGVGLESSIPVTVNVTAVNDNKPTVPDYDRYITEGMTRFSPPLNVQVNFFFLYVVVFLCSQPEQLSRSHPLSSVGTVLLETMHLDH